MALYGKPLPKRDLESPGFPLKKGRKDGCGWFIPRIYLWHTVQWIMIRIFSPFAIFFTTVGLIHATYIRSRMHGIGKKNSPAH